MGRANVVQYSKRFLQRGPGDEGVGKLLSLNGQRFERALCAVADELLNSELAEVHVPEMNG